MQNTQSYQAYLKSPYKSVKHTTYFAIYDELFCRYRNKDITFVEIGVFGGGSLFMWREFFGPKARIIGIDLNPNAKKWEEHGFEIFIGSQSDENFWQKFIQEIGKVDVILDDGGHTYEQQIVTTEMLLPMIKDGGMLVVEDTHTSYMNGFGSQQHSFINYTKNMMDKINHRFGSLNSLKMDNRVWSIQSFESIVAFHINHQESNLLSEPTDNKGIDDSAQDYRYHGNPVIENFNKNVSRFKFLKHIPGMKFLAKKTRELIIKRNLWVSKSLDKYFD